MFMADNKRVYELLKRLYKLCPKCKEQKIDIFFELIAIHLENDNCVACCLRTGVRKIEW